MLCQACSEGDHANCGMQIWCSCECDPEMYAIDLALWDDADFMPPMFIWNWDDYEPDGHGPECTCETCLQDHPERMYLIEWDLGENDDD